TRGADVLLRARVNQRELLDLEGTREDRRGHVGDERYLTRLRHVRKLDAPDRLIRRVVQVRSPGGELERPGLRHTVVARCGLIGGDVHREEALRLADRLLRPGTRVQVVRSRTRRGEI